MASPFENDDEPLRCDDRHLLVDLLPYRSYYFSRLRPSQSGALGKRAIYTALPLPDYSGIQIGQAFLPIADA